MEPISVGLLTALAGGAGGELGRQAWAGLSALVRHPFQRSRHADEHADKSADTAEPMGSGEAELTALEEAPHDALRAQALLDALARRAAADPPFHARLQVWSEQSLLVHTGDGEVRNTITGGTQYGPVLQGRDFSGTISFGTPPSPSAGPSASSQG